MARSLTTMKSTVHAAMAWRGRPAGPGLSGPGSYGRGGCTR